MITSDNIKPLDLEKEMDIISETSDFTGDFSFGAMTRVEGKINGSIKSSGLLYIGEKSQINAHIDGNVVVINGRVYGNVSAKELIVIDSKGEVKGDITGPTINIKDGGKINGKISMSRYHSDFLKALN